MKKHWINLIAIPLPAFLAMTACQQSGKKKNPNVIYVFT